ncbi:MAG TPA: sigma 54-interacting transcriptional regulator [Phycisphaerales bacterium]|nr:sigma 54-interacting transcriptional regulator [Phycisphaerales bacterium]HMP36870.1 sigma 54-interacting transcriptional regulator [Phycisphaerales bacterium]
MPRRSGRAAAETGPPNAESKERAADAADAPAEVAELSRGLAESERLYRLLFEEAPIGYVYEDTDTRFVSANRAALEILGVKPEEVTQTVGLTLVANTPQNQERVRRSIEAERAGKELPFIELELRRKDNGMPVWIQRWSRPEPDGRHTRTMLVDITDRVLAAQERQRLQRQNAYLQDEIKASHNFDEIVGESAALRQVLEQVRLVAPNDTSVLVTGETGTGKELIARALHSASARPRRDHPIIKVNCAAIPSGLVESELFGHERGAFTGAVERRTGRFELADRGTLFLDEVGELPTDVQVRLLRVIQEQEFERVGGSRTVKVNVRIIAATNRDLHAAVADGSFRQDLYYRLNVFPIRVPPLRERREDIRSLAEHFVRRFASRVGRKISVIPEEVMHRLIEYAWPGNVRELENVIERAVILSPGPALEIPAESFPAQLRELNTGREGFVRDASTDGASLRSVEHAHVIATLTATKWVIDGPRGAAARLKMHPNTLRSRMKRLAISRPPRDIS